MFRNCSVPDNLTIRSKTAELHSLFQFYQMSLPVFVAVSLFGILANLFFLVLIIYGLGKRILPRKRFWLVLSRAISDLLTSICTFLWSFLDYASIPLPRKDTIINSLQLIEVSMGFWVVTGSYACLAAVSFIAAKHPLYFRTHVSSKWSHVAIFLLWAWALVYTAALAPFGGGAFFSHPYGQCTGDCQLGLLVVTATLFLLFYVFVPAIYLVLLVSLSHSQSSDHSSHKDHRARSSFWRLGLNVLLYTLFGSPIPLLTAIGILLLEQVSHVRQDPCYSKSIEALWAQKTILIGRMVAHLIWNARTVIDPMVSFLSDRQLRRLARGAELQPCSEYPNARSRSYSMKHKLQSKSAVSLTDEEHILVELRRRQPRSRSEVRLGLDEQHMKEPVRSMSSRLSPILDLRSH